MCATWSRPCPKLCQGDLFATPVVANHFNGQTVPLRYSISTRSTLLMIFFKTAAGLKFDLFNNGNQNLSSRLNNLS